MEQRFDPKAVLLPFEQEKEYVNAKVRDGIEANRKKHILFTVVDAKRQIIPGAKIKLTQKNHEFKHGANLFMLDEMETAEKNAAYKKAFAETFNLATLPFYWNTLEPEEGKPRFPKDSPKVYRRPTPDLCLEYCEANHITPKLHCLNYPFFVPDWLHEKYPTVQQQKARLARRFREIAERYADRIPGIEVTNELLVWQALTPFGSKGVRNELIFNDPEIIEWSFKLAEQYFPANELIINDWGWDTFTMGNLNHDVNQYYMQIERAMLKGARIDSVGIQYHFWSNPKDAAEQAKLFYDPFRMYRNLDNFARLGKPIQLTEMTFPCFGDDEESQYVQAEIVRNVYSIFFSHPAVEAAIYWNLVDGYAHGAQPGDMSNGENKLYGGLMNFDLSPKPALKVLQDLFHKEWRTDALITTNDYGFAFAKLFCGEYDAEIVANGKTIRKTLTISKDNVEEAMSIVL